MDGFTACLDSPPRQHPPGYEAQHCRDKSSVASELNKRSGVSSAQAMRLYNRQHRLTSGAGGVDVAPRLREKTRKRRKSSSRMLR